MKETIQLILHLAIVAVWIAFVIFAIRTYRQHKKELKLIDKFYDDWAKNVHEPFFKWWRQVANFIIMKTK